MRVRNMFLWGAAVILLVAVLLFATTAALYGRVFGRRYEAASRPLALTIADFPGLSATAITFQSGGDTLSGGFYRSKLALEPVDALLIFCHGFSNGSRDYLAQIDYFARCGYEVLAYDNTGCYGSTGDGVRGVPQAAVNLRDVLFSLSTEERFARYRETPLVLMGHSWGGYAVNAVLCSGDYDMVKAVVSFSAPNDSLGMLVEQGRLLLGNAITVFRPFLWGVDRLRFGAFAGYTALDGVNRTSAHVLALHSTDDSVVSYAASLAALQADVTNPNARFIAMEGAGHNTALTGEARAYAQSLQALVAARSGDAQLSATELEALLADVDKLQLYELDSNVLAFVEAFLQDALA